MRRRWRAQIDTGLDMIVWMCRCGSQKVNLACSFKQTYCTLLPFFPSSLAWIVGSSSHIADAWLPSCVLVFYFPNKKVIFIQCVSIPFSGIDCWQSLCSGLTSYMPIQIGTTKSTLIILWKCDFFINFIFLHIKLHNSSCHIEDRLCINQAPIKDDRQSKVQVKLQIIF